VCGILVGVIEKGLTRVRRIIPCGNIEPVERRRNRFSIDPREIIEVERILRGTAEEVVGFYHTHPFSDAVPSGVDLTFMELWPESFWLIVERTAEIGGGRMRVWVWDSNATQQVREVVLGEGRG